MKCLNTVFFHNENGYLCKSESWSLARLKMAIRYDSCADPEIFVSEGGSRSIWHKKKSYDVVFFYCFFSPQLILQKSSGYFQRKLSFLKFKWEWNIFQGGRVQVFFPGGVQLLFPYKYPYNLWYSEGVRTPAPFWIRPCDSAHRGLIYLLVFLFSF